MKRTSRTLNGIFLTSLIISGLIMLSNCAMQEDHNMKDMTHNDVSGKPMQDSMMKEEPKHAMDKEMEMEQPMKKM